MSENRVSIFNISYLRIIKEKTRKIFRSEFFRSAITLMTGTTVSQIIPMLAVPIIARLYTPEDFGILALFVSLLSIFSMIATGMYDHAVMLPKDEKEAINVGILAILITIAISIVSLVTVIFGKDLIGKLLGSEKIKDWLIFIPVMVTFVGVYNTLYYWTNRKKRYKRLAGNGVLQTTGTAGIKIFLGAFNLGAGGLVTSTIIGQAFSVLLLGKQTYNDDKGNYNLIERKTLKKIARKYQDFPKYNMPQSFLDGVRESWIAIIISSFYGPSVLGLFSFTISILNKPLNIVGNAVGQVFYEKAATIYNDKKDLWLITKKTIMSLIYISLPFFIITFFFASRIFQLVFGKQWTQAGVFASIITPWLFLRFITSPISTVPVVLNKQKFFLILGIIYNLSLPLSFLLATSLHYGILIGLLIFTLIGIINIIIQQVWIREISIKSKINY